MSLRKALAITVILFIPLVILLPKQYSGDGIIYSELILKNEVTLNPNHLLIQPVAHLFYKLSGKTFMLSPLEALKILSLISSFLTILLFVLLFRYSEFHWIPASLSTVGFAYSACFLTLFDSSEILIVQMPILLSLLHLALKFVKSDGKEIFNIGFTLPLICLSIVSIAMYITNVFIVIGIFASLFVLSKNLKTRFYIIFSIITVGLISFSLYYLIWTYLIPYNDLLGFVKWIASYRGSGSAEINSYGASIQGFKDITMRFVKLYYGLFSNIIYVDLGPAFKSMISGKNSNCLSYGMIKVLFWIGGILLMSVYVLALLIRLVHIFNKKEEGHKKDLLIICLIIIISVFPFNFYWNNTDDQFWIQLMPAWWFATAILMGQWLWDTKRSMRLIRGMGCVVLSLLLVNNLVFLLWPRNEFNSEKIAGQLVNRITGNSTIIWPGHDRWGPILYLAGQKASRLGKSVEPVALMSYRNSDEFYLALGKLIDEGRSVYLLRVLEIDEECTPWDSLNKKGFFRSELLENLGRNYIISNSDFIFGHTTLAMIKEKPDDNIVRNQIYLDKKRDDSSSF